jgi:hypothetical protein
MSPTRHRPPGFGAQARHRPAGFDARPHRPSSLRAQAQRVFRAAAARDEVLKDPTPNPSPQGGGECCGATEQTTLTRHVRALYENSVVPVHEIARLAGVHQRTLYKYVQKGGWRRRHATQDLASAVAKRAAKRKSRPCVTAKGAGGRFIRGADVGKPFRRGLKALDPQGEARAMRRTRHAAKLAEAASERTRRLREALSDARTLALTMQVLRDLAAIEDAGKPDPAAPDPAGGPRMSDDELRRELARRIEAMAAGDEARRTSGQGG